MYSRRTRDLSPSAKLLYAGLKKTDGGLEIKMHNQADALLHVGRHLGLFRNNMKHANDPENPVQAECIVIMPARVSKAE